MRFKTTAAVGASSRDARHRVRRRDHKCQRRGRHAAAVAQRHRHAGRRSSSTPIAEFNKVHPDVEVQLERQEWTGIVERLTTALSGSDSPDVVEFGNTQAQTFEAAGAVVDLTDKRPTSAATTSCRACSRPARTTASCTPCRTTPALAS